MTKKRVMKETPPALRLRSDLAPSELLNDLRDLIQSARSGVAQAVNSALVLLYWQVGNGIRTETLKFERAAYGERIVVTLSRQLAAEFGHGFLEKNLRRMIQFAELFPLFERTALSKKPEILVKRELAKLRQVEMIVYAGPTLIA